MLSGVGFVVARTALVLVGAFILSKTLPSIPNKLWRFVFLFILIVPFGLLYDYLHVQLLGSSKTSWTFTVIWALLCAVVLTFWGPQLRKSDTP